MIPKEGLAKEAAHLVEVLAEGDDRRREARHATPRALLTEREQQVLRFLAERCERGLSVTIPLDPLPNILIWSDKVLGPV